jgi:hypothetical protein
MEPVPGEGSLVKFSLDLEGLDDTGAWCTSGV